MKRVTAKEPRPELNVLLADDQKDVLTALELLMKSEGFHTRSVSSPEELLSAVGEDDFDALLMDLNYSRDTTSGEEGLELLSDLASVTSAPPAIVMTAWGSIDLAVEAMRRGARDFVLKPWRNEELLETIRRNARKTSPSSKYSRDELRVAARVQSRLWPQSVPRCDTLELAGYCRPVGAVGGDTYDFIDWGDGRIALTLADVCGKGMPAALMMASLQATLRSVGSSSNTVSSSSEPPSLETFIALANRRFFDATELHHYATLFFAVYDDRSRELRYAGCGHPAPILVRCDGSVERLSATAAAFGMLETLEPSTRTVTLSEGDFLVVFSDGIVEACSRLDGRDELGEEGLIDVVRRVSGESVTARLPARVMAERIIAAVVDQLGYRQSDDMTVVVARSK